MRRYVLMLIGVVALSAYATDARAASMQVTYSLSGVANLVGLGPIGNFSGAMVVGYRATGGTISGTAGNIVSGDAKIIGGSLSLPIFFTIFGGATVTGFATGNIVGGLYGGGVGALSGGGGLSLPVAGALLGTGHCTGALCTGVAGIPASTLITAFLPIQGLLNGIAGLPPLPTITFNPGPIGTFGGSTITTQLTATEVSRHYTNAVVPEPSALPLLGMGLVLLVAGRRGYLLRRR